MSYFTFTKRSRKVAHSSKNLKISKRTLSMNQSIQTMHYQQNEDNSRTTTISTDDDDDEPSNFPSNGIDEEENDYKDLITIDKKYPIVRQHVLSKRPRLCYNKRLQANARERERVHNLTAAFEALRQVIPLYHGQSKLSRLSILRIACSYVLVLGALNEIDFSEGQNAYTLNESFHLLSTTILNELKRKKPTNHKND